MAITQQGWRAGTSGGGGGGLTSLPIENTLYVAKNGNDATGERNRLDKPFLTIAGANSVAQLNDCVYVFSGLYVETGDTFSSGVFYHLEDGASVTNSAGALVRDDGVNAKAINIFGNGRLATSSVGAFCVDLTVSTANIECFSISGDNAMILGGECNIIVRSQISANSGVGIALVNDASGYIEFDTLNSINTFAGISANITSVTTSTSDDLYIKGRRFLAEPSGKGAGVYNLFNEGNQLITFEILETICLTQFPMSNIATSNIVFKNGFFKHSNVPSSQGTGFIVNDAKLDLINCTILSRINSFNIQATFCEINLLNCYLSCVGILPNITCNENSTLYIQDSILETNNQDSGANIRTNGTTPVLVIANSQLINELPLGGGQFCIDAQVLDVGETLDIRIQGVCVATFPTSTEIVNLITGTNIIASVNAITIPRNKLP